MKFCFYTLLKYACSLPQPKNMLTLVKVASRLHRFSDTPPHCYVSYK